MLIGCQVNKAFGFASGLVFLPFDTGMDVTVTAPLETGAGHQRLVVAYTLKQGIEKQPDILSAQKSATGSDTSSPLGNRQSGLFMAGTAVAAAPSSAANHKTVDYVSVKRSTAHSAHVKGVATRLGFFFRNLQDVNAPHLNSPPSQSSTLKLESDNAVKGYQQAAAGPLLYDAMPNTLSRYEQLGLNMGSYTGGVGGGGSNSTLSSASSVANATTSSGALGNSPGIGHYAQHLHHTLPHNVGMAQPRGRDPLTLADYLTTSSLIDYNLSKAAASLPTHMTLPKGMGHVASGSGGGGVMPSTSLSPSQLTTITQKSNAGRNHIITDTLPGPESCV